jgi:hypothetical protein
MYDIGLIDVYISEIIESVHCAGREVLVSQSRLRS